MTYAFQSSLSCLAVPARMLLGKLPKPFADWRLRVRFQGSTLPCLDDLCVSQTCLLFWLRKGFLFSDLWKNILSFLTLCFNSFIVLPYAIHASTLRSNYYNTFLQTEPLGDELTCPRSHRKGWGRNLNSDWFRSKISQRNLFMQVCSPLALWVQCLSLLPLIVKADCVVSYPMVIFLPLESLAFEQLMGGFQPLVSKEMPFNLNISICIWLSGEGRVMTLNEAALTMNQLPFKS